LLIKLSITINVHVLIPYPAIPMKVLLHLIIKMNKKIIYLYLTYAYE